METLLEDPLLCLLIIKNTMRVGDRHWLGELEIDELYDKVIHTTIETVSSVYLTKERDKALRRNFRVLEGEKNLHLEEN